MMIYRISSVVLGLLLVCFGMFIQAKSKPKVGKKAPEIELKDDTGTLRKLSEMQGHKMAIYFYPKDFTSGCTAQACSIRNNFDKLEDAGIVVWGISYDSVKSHQDFKKAKNIPFTLLSDVDKKVAKKYGVKRFLPIPKRVTFLIDENGFIVKIIDQVKTSKHADQILKGFGI